MGCSLAPRIHLIDAKCSICPISHAGLIYRFEANDAFRTGMEATLTQFGTATRGKRRSVLGHGICARG